MAGALVVLAVIGAFVAWLAHGWLKELLAVFEERCALDAARGAEPTPVAPPRPVETPRLVWWFGDLPAEDEAVLVHMPPRGEG